MKKTIPLLSITFLLLTMFSCGQKQAPDTSEATVPVVATERSRNYPEILAKALEAHGGINQWESFGTLTFDVADSRADSAEHEHQLIDLWTRKVLLSKSQYKLGFDGKDVWVSPNKEAFGKMSPRFYHNLVFYFFGIPFLLADPGIIYEDLGKVTVAGKAYDALKVSYKEGVGDTPEDLYIAHFNPETHQLELLLYTVTYFSGERHERYNALIYDKWQEVNGLTVPKIMQGYKFENDSIKELRYTKVFHNVIFEGVQPDAATFEMPEEAEIDSLKN